MKAYILDGPCSLPSAIRSFEVDMAPLRTILLPPPYDLSGTEPSGVGIPYFLVHRDRDRLFYSIENRMTQDTEREINAILSRLNPLRVVNTENMMEFKEAIDRANRFGFWGESPGRREEQERQDSLNRELRRQVDFIPTLHAETIMRAIRDQTDWMIAPRGVTLRGGSPPERTKPPPIQPPDCYFCPKKKLDVFFASKRLPGQDGKKRIACQECMEERKEQRIAREVRK